MVPRVCPFTATVTPGISSPPAVTLPVTVISCAYVIMQNSKLHNNEENLFI